MVQWEYDVRYWNEFPRDHARIQAENMAEMGEQGWELVSVVAGNTVDIHVTRVSLIMFFKRPKEAAYR